MRHRRPSLERDRRRQYGYQDYDAFRAVSNPGCPAVESLMDLASNTIPIEQAETLRSHCDGCPTCFRRLRLYCEAIASPEV